MVMVVALQIDCSEKSVNAPGAVAVTGFKGQGLFVVRQQAAVVVESSDDFAAVAQQGLAQPILDPFGGFAGTRSTQGRFGFRDEGFGFGEPFPVCFRVEFFFLSLESASGVWVARKVRVCSILSSASCPQRSLNSW